MSFFQRIPQFWNRLIGRHPPVRPAVPSAIPAVLASAVARVIPRKAVPQRPRVDFDVLQLPVPQSDGIRHIMNALSPAPGSIKLHNPVAFEAEVQRLSALGVETKVIGASREGRPLHALKAGSGPISIVAIAGAHADEPVGTSTCMHFIEKLHTDPALAGLREQVTVHVVPMANPDGTAKNEPWFEKWTDHNDLRAYLTSVVRDNAADDVEFGFADKGKTNARPENNAIAAWFDSIGRIDHYASLHSMFLGGGALFLVNTDEMAVQAPKMRFVLDEAARLRLNLHDKDRFGQKGFSRICAGIHTAPTREGMEEFFAGDANFRLNSMQVVRERNQCPLAMVSEIPLCYDPRLASMEPVEHSRVDEEKRLATGLNAASAEGAGLVARFSGLTLTPEAAASLQQLVRVCSTLAGVANASQNDFARYGDAKATVGNVAETDLALLRRRASVYALAVAAAERIEGEPAKALHDELKATYDGIFETISKEFPLRHPSLETQVQLQQASLIAALVTTAGARS